MIRTIAVLGAGNAGVTAAAHLALRGFRVRLGSRAPERLEPIQERGAIELVGVAGEGEARPELVTAELGAAVEGADLIMLTVAGPGLDDYARRLAPLLRPGQRVLLNPGQCGGALQFRRALERWGAPDGVLLGETSSLTYGCRRVGPAKAWAYVLVQHLPFAALPATRTDDMLQALRTLYPSLEPAPHVLYTSLHYLNCVLHPPGMVCNAGWIEYSRGGFRYYFEGTTPAVARAIEAVDRERLEIVRAYGLTGRTFLDTFYRHGYTTREAWETGSIYRAFQDSEVNKPRMAPETLHHRYMEEDVPYGLVPMAALGRTGGVDTPVIDALITIASVLMGTDYRREGRNAERMGFDGWTSARLLRWVQEGA